MPTEFFTETVDDSGDVHGQVCLAVANPRKPKIAYTTTSGVLMLAEQVGNEWVLSTVHSAGQVSRGDYRVSLALDSKLEPNPHVAYLAEALDDHLIYGLRREAWEFEEVPTEGGLFPGRVRFPAMKLYRGVFEEHDELKDAPHFCYQAGLALHHAAKVRRRDRLDEDPVWKKNVERVAGGGADQGLFATLDFDGRDTLQIAYFDDLDPLGQTARRLHLATMTAGLDFPGQPNSWQVDMLDGGDILGEYPALAHSVTGEGVVSYFERRARALKVCMFGNFPESPAVEVVPDEVDGDDVRSSVALSPAFRWCVAYGSGGRLRFATRTGVGAFAIDDVDTGGSWPSLAFDPDGNAHVGHVEGGTLKYALAPPGDD
jgi:hypothetical protein